METPLYTRIFSMAALSSASNIPQFFSEMSHFGEFDEMKVGHCMVYLAYMYSIVLTESVCCAAKEVVLLLFCN